MSSHKKRIPITLLCLAVLRVTAAMPLAQDERNKSKTGDANKAESKDPPKPAAPKLTVHIKVSAEGRDLLPSGSRMELKGEEESCKNDEWPDQSIGTDGVTFSDVPVCKVRLRIFITGFDAKTVSVDLVNYKDPMRVLVKSAGPPVVSW